MNQTPPVSSEAQGVFALLAVLAEPASYKKRLEELEAVSRQTALDRKAANEAQTAAGKMLAAATAAEERATKELAASQTLKTAADSQAVELAARQERFADYESETRAALQKQAAAQDALGKKLEAERKELAADRVRLDKQLADNAATAAALNERKAKLEKALA